MKLIKKWNNQQHEWIYWWIHRLMNSKYNTGKISHTWYLRTTWYIGTCSLIKCCQRAVLKGLNFLKLTERHCFSLGTPGVDEWPHTAPPSIGHKIRIRPAYRHIFSQSVKPWESKSINSEIRKVQFFEKLLYRVSLNKVYGGYKRFYGPINMNICSGIDQNTKSPSFWTI